MYNKEHTLRGLLAFIGRKEQGNADNVRKMNVELTGTRGVSVLLLAVIDKNTTQH